MSRAILHGQPVSADDVERETSAWGDDRFVSFANSLILASLTAPAERLALTERRGPDGGVDAELLLPATAGRDPFGLTGPGRTIYQFKRRTIDDGASRAKAMSEVKRKLTKEIGAIIGRGERLDCYVAVTNLHLNARRAGDLAEAIRAVAPTVNVRVLHAADLAAIANGFPHLRSAFFATREFATVEAERAAFEFREARRRRSPAAPLGREESEARLSAALEDPAVRVIEIVGPPAAGKTRLALDSVLDKRFRGDVAVAAAIDRLEPKDLRALVTPRREVLLLVDQPLDDARSRRLVEGVLGMEGLRLVITLPHEVERGSRSVAIVPVTPLDDAAAARLVEAAAPAIDPALRSWIVAQSGGLPGVLVEAATLGKALLTAAGDFRTRVGRGLLERLGERVPPPAVDAAKALALATAVRLSSESGEIEALAGAIHLDPADVRAQIDSLAREGALVVRPAEVPHTVEVVPPLLAAALVGEALDREPAALEALLAHEGLRGRVLRRLCELAGDARVRDLTHALFDPRSGPYRDLEALAGALDGLAELTTSFPREIGSALRNRAQTSPDEDLRGLTNASRRSLRASLEGLIRRRESFADALGALLRLAQAEPDPRRRLAGRRTGETLWPFSEALREALAVFHPEIPAALAERAEVLRALWTAASPPACRLLIGAMAATFDERAFRVWPGSGARPPDLSPRATWGDVWAYVATLLALVRGALDDGDAGTAADACGALGPLALEALRNGVREPALQALEALADRAGALGPDETLALVEGLADLEANLPGLFAGPLEGEWQAWRERLAAELPAIRARLGADSFSVRIRRSFGRIVSEDLRAGRSAEELDARLQAAAANLAHETVREGRLAPADLYWLTSEEAFRSYAFFEALGREDQDRRFLPDLRAASGRSRGPTAFSAYIDSWAEGARDDLLDGEAASAGVAAEAILRATVLGPPGARACARVRLLLESARVAAPEAISAVARSDWPRRLEPAALAGLLRDIGAAASPEAAMSAVRLLSLRAASSLPEAKALREAPEVKRLAAEALAIATPRNHDDEFEWFLVARALLGSTADLTRVVLAALEQEDGWAAHSRDVASLIGEFLPADRNRLLESLIDRPAGDDDRFSRLRLFARRVVSPERDRDLLLEVGGRSVESARAVAFVLSGHGGSAAFWQVAGALVARYPNDELLRAQLAAAVGSIGVVGSIATALEEQAARARAYAESPAAPPAARGFAADIADDLSRSAARGVIWEYEIRSGDLERVARTGTAEERAWLAERILRRKPVKEAIRLLRGVFQDAEILALLPTAGIEEKRRRAVESLLAPGVPRG